MLQSFPATKSMCQIKRLTTGLHYSSHEPLLWRNPWNLHYVCHKAWNGVVNTNTSETPQLLISILCHVLRYTPLYYGCMLFYCKQAKNVSLMSIIAYCCRNISNCCIYSSYKVHFTRLHWSHDQLCLPNSNFYQIGLECIILQLYGTIALTANS